MRKFVRMCKYLWFNPAVTAELSFEIDIFHDLEIGIAHRPPTFNPGATRRADASVV